MAKLGMTTHDDDDGDDDDNDGSDYRRGKERER